MRIREIQGESDQIGIMVQIQSVDIILVEIRMQLVRKNKVKCA
jgi:hypothetical protein